MGRYFLFLPTLNLLSIWEVWKNIFSSVFLLQAEHFFGRASPSEVRVNKVGPAPLVAGRGMGLV